MESSACNRIVSSVTARVEAFKSAPLENPPPGVMVDGMWVKIAYPSDEIKADALGRRGEREGEQREEESWAHGGLGPGGLRPG